MVILFSPTKQMQSDYSLSSDGTPIFPKETKALLSYLQGLSYEEIKTLYAASDKIAKEAYGFIQDADLEKWLTPALFSYSGIAFQYLEPRLLNEEETAYLQNHLCLLSALYGVVLPLQGVCRYRLEMQNKISFGKYRTLYAYWGDALYQYVHRRKEPILNLASEEYASAVRRYLGKDDVFIDVFFGEKEGGRYVEKGVYAKMARGRMVRYLAQIGAESFEEVKGFHDLGYAYNEEESTPTRLVFTRNSKYDVKD